MEEFYIVGVGASAGGQQALQDFIANIPRYSNAGYVIVTHLQRDYNTNLHTILSRFSAIPVSLITNGERIEKNHIYIMPPNCTLTICDRMLFLERRTKSNLNRAINSFLESLSKDVGECAIAVILSGASNDGAMGAAKISHAGGKVFVQDPESSLFSSMPNAAIKADHPVAIMPAAELAKEIVALTSGEAAKQF
jgi:chemotaxis response regulator CheB